MSLIDQVKTEKAGDSRVVKIPPPREGRVPQTAFHNTDLGNAKRLVDRDGADLRYCHAWGNWLHFDDRRWVKDEVGEVMRRAKETVVAIYAEAAQSHDGEQRKALALHARRSESEARLKAMIELAKSEPGIPVTPSQLDADPWALNVLNGTIDLKTGKLRPHDRADLITKIAPAEYDPDAKHPMWDKVIHDATGGDQGLKDYLPRAFGAGLCGEVLNEVLFFVYGPAATCKTTIIEAVTSTLGDYAARADFETFLAKSANGGPREDIARLAGARLVTSVEVSDGRRLAVGLVKLLTGGDTVAARFLYGRTFEFRPQFTLVLAANHAPHVDEDDEALWRRMRRIPFNHIIPEERRDPGIKRTLTNPAKAGAAILAWMVQGCLDWQEVGLDEPDAVKQSTTAYREEVAVFGAWIDECCHMGFDAEARAQPLYESYKKWAEENGYRPLGSKRFAQKLRERNLKNNRDRRGRIWLGIGLLDDKSV